MRQMVVPSRRLFHQERIARLANCVDPYRLRLGISLDGLPPVLPSDTAGLVAAERRHVADGAIGIYPDCSSLKPGSSPENPGYVGSPYSRRKTVSGIVGECIGLILVFEGDHRKHGTEYLLLGDPHRIVDAREDGRLDKPARLQCAIPGASAAQFTTRTLG